MKPCSKCRIIKDLVDYSPKKQTKDGRQSACKLCCSPPKPKRQSKSGYTGKEARKNISLKFHYNLGLAEYNLMLMEQSSCCAVCNTHRSKLKRDLHVDHCHSTGKIRKLLCSACNAALGLLKESPMLATNLIKYMNEVCV